jgi:hypothetical protein
MKNFFRAQDFRRLNFAGIVPLTEKCCDACANSDFAPKKIAAARGLASLRHHNRLLFLSGAGINGLYSFILFVRTTDENPE